MTDVDVLQRADGTLDLKHVVLATLKVVDAAWLKGEQTSFHGYDRLCRHNYIEPVLQDILMSCTTDMHPKAVIARYPDPPVLKLGGLCLRDLAVVLTEQREEHVGIRACTLDVRGLHEDLKCKQKRGTTALWLHHLAQQQSCW